MSDDKNTEWFENWFDSTYYYILYNHRDWKEAELFIDNLISFLKPKPNSKVFDMPCGKGRHSVYMNKKGFDVTGIDLSPKSIACAKEYANQHLSFFVHDMRKLFRENYFNIALNLFTSIGYFENDKENADTITSASAALKTGGVFILDFMNSEKIQKCLVSEENKNIDGIRFKVKRKIENGFVVKNIDVVDGDKKYSFFEKVKLLTLNDFKNYFSLSGLKITRVFGNYSLDKFDENISERLIIVGRKVH